MAASVVKEQNVQAQQRFAGLCKAENVSYHFLNDEMIQDDNMPSSATRLSICLFS